MPGTNTTLQNPGDLNAFIARACRKRMVFLTGLPGVGKSLLVRELARAADAAGKTAHLLQWDVIRCAFETPEILARYPEVDGVTHPLVRTAAGAWARTAVGVWAANHDSADDILIGEVPLVGFRLMQLVQRSDDGVEELLAGPDALFTVPVPSRRVRSIIEQNRGASSAQPQHEQDRNDAMPTVMRALWSELLRAAEQLQFGPVHSHPHVAAADGAYSPETYAAVYGNVLQHRQHEILLIDYVSDDASTSVHEFDVPRRTLEAAAPEVEASLTAAASQHTEKSLADAVGNWYRV